MDTHLSGDPRFQQMKRAGGTAAFLDGAGPAPCRPAPIRVDALSPARAGNRDPIQPALSLSGIIHHYGAKRAVDQVSLGIAPGEIVCLVGPSGCGKSTLLRLAAGLETVQQGTVGIVGRTIAGPGYSLAPEKRGIGLVFQDYALFPHLSVMENVCFGLDRLPRQERRERALAVLRQVGMESYAGAWPHALSGGQQQRVALARAMAPKPAVLLLDEPFSGLDARLRETVRDQTLHVLKQSGAATLIVTHDPEEAMFLADRIALMRDGRLVQLGAPADLYNRPVDRFAASFFGEVNEVAGIVQSGRVETPVGSVPVAGQPDGTRVQVLIRPEGLSLSMCPEEQTLEAVPNLARVEASRLLGRSSLVHLSIYGQAGPVHLHARVPGQFLPAEDSHVSVALDVRQTFVFPTDVPT